MEFCRRWGIADAVRDAGAPPDFPATILYVTGLQGYELARIERPTHGGREPLPITPERPQRCNQIWFDPILRDLASGFDTVTLRYQCRFERFERTGDGVIATLHDTATGRTEQVAARYLVSCCGGCSTVPDTLGVKWEGTMVLSYNLNIFIRAPELWNYSNKGKAAFHIIVRADGSQGTLIELDGRDLWRLGVRNVSTPIDINNVDLDAEVRRVLGPGVPYEVISALPWTCRSIVADRFQDGPVFLAGDAVHQNAPSGGFGMNTGMGDAVDLGWKLAATLDGWAGSGLLDSYQTERRAVALRNVGEATDNNLQGFDRSLVPLIEDATPAGEAARRRLGEQIVRAKTKQYVSDGVALGYCYDPSPVICPDGTPPPSADPMKYIPTSRPGSRAPHGWVSGGTSTLDLFGRGFVLLRFGDSVGSRSLEDAAARRGVPLTCVDVADPALARLYERPLVLVRPDGHVAWRGDVAPADPVEVIDTVRGAGG
jgi:2-polyprenyl-6-methoxyphenol hydroxylase-like FAD-dependent oxidoreductase